MPEVLARRNVNKRIRKRLQAKHAATLKLLAGIDKAIDNKGKIAARVIAAHVEAGDNQRAIDEVDVLRVAIVSLLWQSFRALADWSWRETVQIIAREVPRAPLAELIQQEPEPGEPPIAPDDEPLIAIDTLNLSAWSAYLASTLFTQPPREQIRRTIVQPVGGIAWPDRVQAWSQRASFKVAQTVFNRGQQLRFGGGITPQGRVDLQVAIRSELQEFILASQRIAEHEGLRVANAIQRAGYGPLGSLLAGVIILNPLDSRTRPRHRQRAGTIYWTEPGRQPNIVDMPLVPDDFNCRCWDAPILWTDLN